MVVGKHLICQKVIVPYMKDADNDILFTMEDREEILQICVRSETASSDEI